MNDWDEENKAKMKAKITITGIEEVKGTTDVKYYYKIEMVGTPIEKCLMKEYKKRLIESGDWMTS